MTDRPENPEEVQPPVEPQPGAPQPVPPPEDRPATLRQPDRPPRRKARWGRRILVTVLVLVVLLVLLVALAPTLLSTGPGNRLAERIVNRQIDGRASISGLSIGWTSGVQVERAIVEDRSQRRVVEVADLSTELTLLDAIRGRMAFGQTRGRINLPVVLIYDDDSTNLHEVFRIDPAPDDPDDPLQIPDFTVDAHLAHFRAGIQYVGRRGDATDDGPIVAVEMTDARLRRMPGQPLEHDLPISLAVGGTPAGTILARGTVDLDTLGAERPTVQQDLQVTDLDLEALDTALAAFGILTDYRFAGHLDGQLDADLAQNQIAGRFTGRNIALNTSEAAAEGEPGYETTQLQLNLDGSWKEQALPQDQHVRLEDGTLLTTRQIAGIEQLELRTDDGVLTATASVDVLILRTDPMGSWPELARDVTLNLQSDFATAQGQGADLGSFTLTATADAGQMHERLGAAMPLSEMQPRGQFDVTLQTQRVQGDPGPIVQVDYQVSGSNVTLNPPPEGQLAFQQTPRGQPQGPQLPQPPQGQQPPVQPQAQPLRFQTVEVRGQAALAPQAEGVPPEVTSVTADVSATDAEGQPLLNGSLAGSGIDISTGSVGRADVRELNIPEYARLQRTLAGWVDLPEAEQPVEPLQITGAASVDGATTSIRVLEPLRVLLGGEEMAAVSGEAQQPEEGAWRLANVEAVAHMPVAGRLLESLGMALEGGAAGRVVVRVPSDAGLHLETADPVGTLRGRAEAELQETEARGMAMNGRVPLVFGGGAIAIPAEAEPIDVNGGPVAIAGTRAAREAEERWVLYPAEGQLFQGVSLNPAFSTFLGQFVNPIFVRPQQANGLLDLSIQGPARIDLSDPLGANTQLAITFSVRQLHIDNDLIAQVADAAAGDIIQAVQAQVGNIPGVDRTITQRLEAFDLSEEVRQEISSIRGNIMNAQVSLQSGTAQTQITFNVADPRHEAAAGQAQLYPLGFSGDINLQTRAMNLSTTIPRQLIEKWVGESPGDLEAIFGPRPFERLIPEGVTLGLTGTTASPVPDVSAFTRNVLPRAVQEAVRGRAEDEIRRRLRGLLDR